MNSKQTELETDYKLIPMSKITDEARQLAVRWVEGYRPVGSINLEQKHKLASDIMNYARRYAASLPAASPVSDVGLKLMDNVTAYAKGHEEGRAYQKSFDAATPQQSDELFAYADKVSEMEYMDDTGDVVNKLLTLIYKLKQSKA